jgi:Phage integrase family
MLNLVPRGPSEPVWWTLRRPFRPLTYDAARMVFAGVNQLLGANWTLHDLRHSAAKRMLRDPDLTLADVQWVLGHAHITTTQIYTAPAPRRGDQSRAGSPRSAADPGGLASGPASTRLPAGSIGHVVRLIEDHRGGMMPRKVHDGPAMGTAQRPAPAQPREWEPRPLPGTWWQTCQEREALAGRLLTALTAPGAGRGRDQTRRRGLTKLLDWLQSQLGETWQDPWLASGADAGGFEWAGLPLGGEPSRRHRRDELTSGLVLLVAGQVIRPTYRWLMRQRHAPMLAEARKAIDPEGFDRLEQHAQGAIGWARSDALNKLTWIVICKGGLVADVTVGDCVELTAALEEHHFRGSAGRPLFYALLKETGILPAAAPPRLRALRIDGRRSIEQIIDKYGIECRPVLDLMVEYFTERAPDLDHTSLRSIVRNLCRLFWRDLEIHHPGIDSLHLAPEVAGAWKERLSFIRDADGRPAAACELPQRAGLRQSLL